MLIILFRPLTGQNQMGRVEIRQRKLREALEFFSQGMDNLLYWNIRGFMALISNRK